MLASFLALALTNEEMDVARYTALTKEIRCVVCQSQSLADSNAPLAIDMRRKIQSMISENKSDDEIKDYLVKRYGEFILLRPRLNKLTYLLWSFPCIGLAIAALILYLARLRSSTRR